MNTPGGTPVPHTHSAPSSSRHPSNGGAGPVDEHEPAPWPGSMEDPQFNLIGWHPAYQSCQRYFVNHAQHSGLVQAVAAFVNIRLPFQWRTNAVTSLPQVILPISGSSPNFHDGMSSSTSPNPASHAQYPASTSYGQRQVISNPPLAFVSLVPYLRRLIVTGFDTDGIMHGFFGNDWVKGVGPLHEVERRNYLFAAKSSGWAKVKYQYDGGSSSNGDGDETVPFMKPLQRVQIGEIERGERAWSEWLCMEDWMVGPHAPPPDMDMDDGNDEEGHRVGGSRMGAAAASPQSHMFAAMTGSTTASPSAPRSGHRRDESMS
jgi:hypothetical protein